MTRTLWFRLSLAFALVVAVTLVFVLVPLEWTRRENTVRNVVRANLQERNGLIDRLRTSYLTHGTWQNARHIIYLFSGGFGPGRRAQPVQFVLADAQGEVVVSSLQRPSLDPTMLDAWTRYISTPQAALNDPAPEPAAGTWSFNQGSIWPVPVPLHETPQAPQAVTASALNDADDDDDDEGLAAYNYTLTAQQLDDAVPIHASEGTLGYLYFMTQDLDEQDVLQTYFTRRLLEALLLASLIGSGISIAMGVLFSRWLTAPLRQLGQSVLALRDGKRAQRAQVTGSRETRALASAFNDMATTLEQNEQARRNMVADVAHELRTPLTVLQSNLYAMLDDVYPLDKGHIARLYDQTRMLNRLVEDLHQLALADADQLPLNKAETDLGCLLMDAAAMFEPAAEAKQITLTHAIPENLPPLALDAERIHQVLYNLLNNALRHTPQAGTVTLSARHEAQAVVVQIQDTGEGIPPAHLAHIFDRFYRVSKDRNRTTGGSGLGLPIARAIMQAHGGQIRAASTLGQGTTFTLYFPLTGATARID